MHEAERREQRARTKLKHAEDDMRDARKDGQDAADDAQTTGLLLQGVLRTMPAGVLGSPGLPSEAQLGEAGNVPKPQNVPISEMQPPKDWAPWEKILGGLAALGSRTYHDPLGTAKALVDYDDLANGRPFDWVGGMGLSVLSGGAGTIPSRGSRLTRVIGSPNIERLGRTPFPINSRKFAGTKLDFNKPDFGARPGTGVPNIPESRRLQRWRRSIRTACASPARAIRCSRPRRSSACTSTA